MIPRRTGQVHGTVHQQRHDHQARHFHHRNHKLRQQVHRVMHQIHQRTVEMLNRRFGGCLPLLRLLADVDFRQEADAPLHNFLHPRAVERHQQNRRHTEGIHHAAQDNQRDDIAQVLRHIRAVAQPQQQRHHHQCQLIEEIPRRQRRCGHTRGNRALAHQINLHRLTTGRAGRDIRIINAREGEMRRRIQANFVPLHP